MCVFYLVQYFVCMCLYRATIFAYSKRRHFGTGRGGEVSHFTSELLVCEGA